MSGIEPVLRTLSTGVTARPRLTHYDTVDGFPERIELSGRVLLNWVHKAANLLREEFDLEPGARVVVDLPAGHWRAAYWALAAWAVGACVVVPSPEMAASDSSTDTDSPAQDADVVVSRDAGDGATWPPRVVVTLAALARRHPDGVPQGAFDEAAVLSTYGDVFDDGAEPDPDAPALVTAGADGEEIVSTFAELSASGAGSGAGSGAEANERVLLVDPSDAAATLRTLLHTWAADGSVVVSRSEAQSPEEDALQRLADSEGITRRA